MEETTWESEDQMGSQYPQLLVLSQLNSEDEIF